MEPTEIKLDDNLFIVFNLQRSMWCVYIMRKHRTWSFDGLWYDTHEEAIKAIETIAYRLSQGWSL